VTWALNSVQPNFDFTYNYPFIVSKVFHNVKLPSLIAQKGKNYVLTKKNGWVGLSLDSKI